MPRKTKRPTNPTPEPPLRLEWRSPAELAENPDNWRRHGDAQLSALTDVIADVGWAGACLFNERTGRLIDGHARRKVALDQGADKVPVLIGDWSESDEAKILATLDPLAAMAEADAGALKALLDGVQTSSQAVADMLTALAEASGVVPAMPEPGSGGDEFDPTPAASGPTRTKAGELWVIGGKHRLLVGDCTVPENVARLMGGERSGMMFADPPYGVSYVGKTADALTIDNDGAAGLPVLLAGAFAGGLQAVRKGGAWYVAAPPGPLHWEFAKQLMDLGVYRQTLVWVKDQFVLGHSDYHYRHEPIFYGWVSDGDRHEPPTRDQDSVWEIARPKRSEDHPTMKPVELIEKAIGNSSDGSDIVYDPFLGSGTTLIAAHRLGRVCYGCEIEPRYADVILKRAEAEGLTAALAETAP